MKNAFDGFLSRLEMANERISGLEGRSIDISKKEKQREKKNENKSKQRQNDNPLPPTRTGYPELWDNYKQCNVCIRRLPEYKKQRKKQKTYSKQS